MANWKSKLNISDLHSKWEKSEISTAEVAKEVAIRLKANKFANLQELQNIIDDLENLGEDSEAHVDDYDYCLEQLYNFGDAGHRIWIETS